MGREGMGREGWEGGDGKGYLLRFFSSNSAPETSLTQNTPEPYALVRNIVRNSDP